MPVGIPFSQLDGGGMQIIRVKEKPRNEDGIHDDHFLPSRTARRVSATENLTRNGRLRMVFSNSGSDSEWAPWTDCERIWTVSALRLR